MSPYSSPSQPAGVPYILSSMGRRLLFSAAVLSLGVCVVITTFWVISGRQEQKIVLHRSYAQNADRSESESISLRCHNGILAIEARAATEWSLQSSVNPVPPPFRPTGKFLIAPKRRLSNPLEFELTWKYFGFAHIQRMQASPGLTSSSVNACTVPIALPWLLSAILPVLWLHRYLRDRRLTATRGFEPQINADKLN
jgi:hypothetical protein